MTACRTLVHGVVVCHTLSMPTAAESREAIRHLTWKIETSLPWELAHTTHARSVARIRRELAEAQRDLSRAVSDLGSAVQAELHH